MNNQTAFLRQPPTRQEIVLLLKKRGSISVHDMAEHLGVTDMAIRKHIPVLERDKYIQSTVVRQPIGRPTAVYQLTARAERLFPNQYEGLATELIDEITDLLGESMVSRLFVRRRERLEQKYKSVMAGQDFGQRVADLAKLQNDEGYMVTWEKRNDGTYAFEEANCPVAQVAVRYRQACSCELDLFAAVLDADVERTACIAEGNTTCRYLIAERSKHSGTTGGAEPTRR